MARGRWTAVGTAWLLFACTTTEQIDGAALQALRNRRPSAGPLVLEDPGGVRIRLDPSSKIRLTLDDGRRTEWVSAERLAVTEDGRLIDGDRYLNLDEVVTVEVENVDGVETYLVTVGAVVVAAAAIAIAVLSSKSKGSGSGGRARAVPAAAAAGPRIEPRYPVGTPWFYHDPWLHPVRPAFVFPIAGGGARRAGDDPRTVDPMAPNRLFTDAAVRRSTISPLLQLEAGYGFDPRTGGGLSVGGGFAIEQWFEISGGLRLNDVAGEQRVSFGYVRAGGNFPFDADDVFGAPIALDIGISGEGFRSARVLWGFRWRFPSRLELAFLPANPMLIEDDGETYFDFPTMLQVGYRF